MSIRARLSPASSKRDSQAEEGMFVNKVIDPEDMMRSRVDEKSVMLYVSMLYYAYQVSYAHA